MPAADILLRAGAFRLLCRVCYSGTRVAAFVASMKQMFSFQAFAK